MDDLKEALAEMRRYMDFEMRQPQATVRLRDEMAKAALTGLLANSTGQGSLVIAATYAYEAADAMLKARLPKEPDEAGFGSHDFDDIPF